ncbi:pirin family protein [Aestuariivirga sp.]|uniref:pirin family protein n=1 Tax=Aestuariivirga sp. TaxID=2650926 RepID=UPI0025C53A64|nr:pirin family protein [Aestuariivirga sp.]MCA3555825.1 pirin family protein [Aestuariivirga sp.]
MSLPHIPDPMPGDAAAADAIETVIVPRAHDLGGFEVRRALPSAQRQMVGPFIFFDQMGPALMRPGQGIDVRPHPHIGLATVTWLFDGSIYHRDSLGSAQPISPGELNWMTAGSGIVHSERTAPPDLARERKVFGIQSWVALPKQHEEAAPAFDHVEAHQLPVIDGRGISARIIAGSLYGAASPVKTYSDLFYADARMAAGSALPLPVEHEERGVYVAEGGIEVAGQAFGEGRLLVFRPGDAITLRARTNARVMLLGGEPMDGPRYIWWNFVSSSKERIEAAKDDWKQARFAIVPGDEKDFIPLPGK